MTESTKITALGNYMALYLNKLSSSAGDILMMETVRASETSVYFNETTRRCVPRSCVLLFRVQFTRNATCEGHCV
jgi:hypothetical protein